MHDIKHLDVTFKADEAGAVTAVFSTFNIVDKGGDIVLPSAIAHGQAVPMVWHHDWTTPIGKGVIRVETDRAIFEGAFFLDTQAGQEAYKTVKAMGDLQQWSWAARVVDAAYEQRDGEFVRVIKKTEVFEVSPVLVGEGENTHTLSIKSEAGYADHAETLVAAVAAFVERSRGRQSYRAKEGRTLSQANRDRLATLRESLAAIQADLDELLAATEPAPKDKDTDTEDTGKSLRLRARAAGLALAFSH